VQGVPLWHFRIYLQSTLVRFILTIVHLYPPPPYLKLPTVFIVLFSYKYVKYINHIHPPSPTSTLPLTGPVLHSCPSLFKCMFIVQRGFAMVCHLWIYCTLIRLTPLWLSLTLPPSPSVNSFHCFSLYILPTQIRCISVLFTIIFFLSPSSPSLIRQSHYCKRVL
jgi:hypothetical protein